MSGKALRLAQLSVELETKVLDTIAHYEETADELQEQAKETQKAWDGQDMRVLLLSGAISRNDIRTLKELGPESNDPKVGYVRARVDHYIEQLQEQVSEASAMAAKVRRLWDRKDVKALARLSISV
jgi:hypothetical protein